MFTFLQQVCSHLHVGQSTARWHSVLKDPRTAVLLRQEDSNIAHIQNVLAEFSSSRCNTFSTVITSLTVELCLAEKSDLMTSYIRSILEVFILYSIATSDYMWILKHDAADLERQVELIAEVTNSLPQRPVPSDLQSQDLCVQMAGLLDASSRRDQLRAEIINKIIRLVDTLSVNSPFTMFNHNDDVHRCNAAALLRMIKPTGHYWIAMAYCLATEDVLDSPPKYAQIFRESC